MKPSVSSKPTIIDMLGVNSQLAAKTMSFLKDKDIIGLTKVLGNPKFRKYYAEKWGSSSSLYHTAEATKQHAQDAWYSVEYAIHLPTRVSIGSNGGRTYYNSGTNLWAALSLIPAGYSLVKLGLNAGKCSFHGALYIVGFFAGSIRDVARTCTKPKPLKIIRPSEAFLLPSESNDDGAEDAILRAAEMRY